jgi:hypothetical protein
MGLAGLYMSEFESEQLVNIPNENPEMHPMIKILLFILNISHSSFLQNLYFAKKLVYGGFLFFG